MAERKLQSGDLDRKVDILVRGTHKNSKGGTDGYSYGPFLTGIWANKNEKADSEKPEETRETSIDTVTFTLRYRTDLDKTMRLVCEGVEYDIENIIEGPGRRQWTILKCKRHN